MTTFVRKDLQIDHPWRDLMWIWGLKPEDLGQRLPEFIAKYGHSTDSLDKTREAHEWICAEFPELLARMASAQGRPVRLDTYEYTEA